MFMRLLAAIAELRETREELARTAVSEERLRFSRDLHDLLGHTLSVMVVKAEAVRRLARVTASAPPNRPPTSSRSAATALQQVRLAVTGYRGRGLDAEIDGARTALADAGIEAVIRRDTRVAASPETDALLGWAVREGVTNVIRHSGARRCGSRSTERPAGAPQDRRQRLRCAAGLRPQERASWPHRTNDADPAARSRRRRPMEEASD